MPEHKTPTTENETSQGNKTIKANKTSVREEANEATKEMEKTEKTEYKEHRGRPQVRRHVNELCQPYASGREISEADCEAVFSAFSLLQEKWVLFIIHSLLEGPIGFNELSRRAHKVNTTTLTQRLMLLEQNGIVKRTVYSMMPPRTTYELTEAGLALREAIEAIERWGKQYGKNTTNCDPVE